jgi:homoserine acetyltransferase
VRCAIAASFEIERLAGQGKANDEKQHRVLAFTLLVSCRGNTSPAGESFSWPFGQRPSSSH